MNPIAISYAPANDPLASGLLALADTLILLGSIKRTANCAITNVASSTGTNLASKAIVPCSHAISPSNEAAILIGGILLIGFITAVMVTSLMMQDVMINGLNGSYYYRY